MPLTPEIEQAAKALGAALHENETVKEYLQAAAEVDANAELSRLESELIELYNQLSAREQRGQVLLRHEINHYHALRDQLRNHPLFVAREEHLRAVKTAFSQSAEVLNSILAMDFTALVD